MIQKHRDGRYEVRVYHPTLKRKVYVGRRERQRDAKALEREREAEFKREAAGEKPPELWTVSEFAAYWLKHKHGENTKRPALSTYKLNKGNLKPLLEEFGDRMLTSMRRREALHFAAQYPNSAKVAAAMFRDAADEELIPQNVFANRGQKRASKGRENIAPLTAQEVDELGQIAQAHWGSGYGEMCRAWVLFLAWTGCRPSEAFQATWEDVDLDAGLFHVRRVKPPYAKQTVILPPPAASALGEMKRRYHRDNLLFVTAQGHKIAKGGWNYYWGPVRKTFLDRLRQRNPARFDLLTSIKGATDLYALRHMCASWMVEHGSNEYDGSHQLGNTPEVFRGRYMHRYEENVRARNRSVFDRSVVDLDAARLRRMGGSK